MTEVLSGVDTLARLLILRRQLDARDGLDTATMVSGYPGSPLGGFDLTLDDLGDRLAEHRIIHRPGLNEELAAAIVWGSQMGAVIGYDGVDGVAGAWYGKGPGLDRSGDSLRHGNAMGAGPNGGVVLFCGDDPAAKSSTLACDSQYTLQDACVPVLFPGDQQDALDLGVHAFRMSRHAGCWVGMKIVTAVADGIGTVDLGLDRHAPADPFGGQHRPLATVGSNAVPEQEILVVERRLRAAQAYARRNGLDRVSGAGPGARLGVICAGKTYFDLRHALPDPEAADVRVLRLGLTYPLVEETVLDFAGTVDELLVIEEKRPFIETQLRAILHEAGSRVPVLGKRQAHVPLTGELDPAEVGDVLGRVTSSCDVTVPCSTKTGTRPSESSSAAKGTIPLPLLPIPARSPGYCSGCPHNRSTVAPDGALVGGGVGCHGIMYFEARQQGLRSLPPTPMGAEGVPWIGLSPFVAEPHVIQNLGDGTLSHSGTLAIRAAVAAGVDITYKILYNAAVAMTGGQEVTGLLEVPALTRALAAEGVRRIVVCAEDPRRYGRGARWAAGARVVGRDRLEEMQEKIRHEPGVTVIIYDQRCAAQARRLRKRGQLAEPPRRVVINEAVCEGCGDCGVKSNCLSVLPVDTEFGEKRRIHDQSCNRDYSCLDGDCPSFVTITPKRGGRPANRTRPGLPAGPLPDPVIPAVTGRYGIYFTGIGGTGVVTASRIIATAAEAAGLAIGGMDQTGLAQKAGAVVSHLYLAKTRAELGAATVTTADLYLSGDILQAANPKHLAKLHSGRTIAVIDNGLTPTSAMLQSDLAKPDVAGMEVAITDRTGPDRVTFVDAKRIAERVFADHLLANVLLLGVAWQLGGLPLALADIDKALRGRADNRAAFDWGRWIAHDPAAVEAALPQRQRSLFDPSPRALARAGELVGELPLRDLLIRRTAQVIDYQNVKLARRFLDLVARVARDDAADRDWALTRAVAESWFKLLTYKDEYEVARLHLKSDYPAIARDLGIDGDYSVTYHLHPPILRRLGLRRKLPMGRTYALGFQVLARLKWLRGTPFDLFGLDPDRRAERALIEEFEELISADRPYAQRVRLAESALSIKGYAKIKEAAVAAWRERVSDDQAHPVR